MSRLFCYGDCHTKFMWSTWADILAKNLKLTLENRGQDGAGNNFFAYRLSSDLKNGLIKPNDQVHVMWAHFHRVSGITDYNTFKKLRPAESFLQMRENQSNTFNIIRDTEKLLLENNIFYQFYIAAPFTTDLKFYNQKDDWSQINLKKKVMPSMHEIVFDNKFFYATDLAVHYGDWLLDSQREKVKTEAESLGLSEIDYIRLQIKNNPSDFSQYLIATPTPSHHLNYLKQIYPELEWSSDLKEDIQKENYMVMNKIWHLGDWS